MERKQILNVVPVLVDPAHKGTPSKVLFSPGKPASAILLYEDAPPELHDLRVAGAHDQMEDGQAIEMNSRSRIDGIKFRDAACGAAFRPGHDELAIVFGQGDAFINRVDPVNARKLEPIYFENPVCVAYSADGDLLVAAASDGTVSIFRLGLSDEDEAEELRTVHLNGKARTIGFDELSGLVLVATENNSLIEFAINSDEDEPVSRGVELEDGSRFNSMQLNTVAYGDDGVIGYAGVGNEIWIATALEKQGGVASLRQVTRIYSLQFVPEESTIVALSDFGVHVLSFGLDEERRPVVDKRVVHFSPLSPEMPMIGCQHFGTMILIASVLPPE